MNLIGKKIELTVQVLPEKKGDFVFTPYQTTAEIIKEVKPLYEYQLAVFVRSDKSLSGKTMNKEKYENVKILFLVLNEFGAKDEFYNNQEVFCTCEYIEQETEMFDEMKVHYRTKGVITLTAKVQLKS